MLTRPTAGPVTTPSAIVHAAPVEWSRLQHDRLDHPDGYDCHTATGVACPIGLGVGADDRLAKRIAGLLVQRARVEALRQAGAVDEVVTAALLDELDVRIALLGERLAGA